MKFRKFSDISLELKRIKKIENIKANPIVKATILSLLKTVPIIGELIDATIDVRLSDFQKKKREELLDIILANEETITSEMVNDIQFIINFAKTLDSINRLATNDKVVYFANLVKYSYLTSEKIKNDEFEEYLRILNELTFREIKYLVFLYMYEKNNDKGSRDYWFRFQDEFEKEFGLPKYSEYDIFRRLESTGLINAEIEVSPGCINSTGNKVNELQADYEMRGIDLDYKYFETTDYFSSFKKRIIGEG